MRRSIDETVERPCGPVRPVNDLDAHLQKMQQTSTMAKPDQWTFHLSRWTVQNEPVKGYLKRTGPSYDVSPEDHAWRLVKLVKPGALARRAERTASCTGLRHAMRSVRSCERPRSEMFSEKPSGASIAW